VLVGATIVTDLLIFRAFSLLRVRVPHAASDAIRSTFSLKVFAAHSLKHPITLALFLIVMEPKDCVVTSPEMLHKPFEQLTLLSFVVVHVSRTVFRGSITAVSQRYILENLRGITRRTHVSKWCICRTFFRVIFRDGRCNVV